MERSTAVKKWEEDHLVGNAGCDRVMKLDGINSFKSGSGKLSESERWKPNAWKKWKTSKGCNRKTEKVLWRGN